ncbi:MAG: Crp/Fnr family transcriptional regulator [Gemmatimonas sp.]
MALSSRLAVAGSPSASLTSCAHCSVKSLALYGAQTPDAANEVVTLRRECRRVSARRMILRAGEVPQEIYTLLEGWAYRFLLLPDGRRQILGYYLPGNIITLESLHMARLHMSVQALTDVTLCVFDIDRFKRFVKDHPGIADEAERACVQRTIRTDNRLMDLGRRTAQEKLARLILDTYVRLARRGRVEGRTFTWPLRHEHIADTLGLTPVHVSRTLRALRQQDLVDVQGQAITILDDARMLMTAGLPEDFLVPGVRASHGFGRD